MGSVSRMVGDHIRIPSAEGLSFFSFFSLFFSNFFFPPFFFPHQSFFFSFFKTLFFSRNFAQFLVFLSSNNKEVTSLQGVLFYNKICEDQRASSDLSLSLLPFFSSFSFSFLSYFPPLIFLQIGTSLQDARPPHSHSTWFRGSQWVLWQSNCSISLLLAMAPWKAGCHNWRSSWLCIRKRIREIWSHSPPRSCWCEWVCP